MNSARSYVLALYARFEGQVPVKVGITCGFGAVYPFVFEDGKGLPMGLVGCAWNEEQASDLVQIYHVSAFKPKQGAGTKIMRHLCAEADRMQVKLYLQAQPQYIDVDKSISEEKLQDWYRSFGFKGSLLLTRLPNAI